MDNIEIVQMIKRPRTSDKPFEDYETRCYEGRSVYTEETVPQGAQGPSHGAQGPPQGPPQGPQAPPQTEKATVPEACTKEPEDANANENSHEAHEDDVNDVNDVNDVDGANDITEVIEPGLKNFYRTCVGRTALQCANESSAPQRSTLWLEARRYCITASNFGAAVGHNSYMSPEQLVADKIWSCFKGNAFTAFGTFHENDASKSLEGLLDNELQSTLKNFWTSSGHTGSFKWRLHEVGLLKWHKKPWMAVSPDGLLELYAADSDAAAAEWILVEYKCPARQRDSDAHPYAKWSNNVPDYYMDQIQGVMGLLNDAPELLPGCQKGLSPQKGPKGPTGPKKCIFLVWQKHQVHISWVPFEAKYWSTSLEPGLRSWYFKKYLPRAYLKSTDSLVQGTLLAGKPIVL
jgi:hypothetical protein